MFHEEGHVKHHDFFHPSTKVVLVMGWRRLTRRPARGRAIMARLADEYFSVERAADLHGVKELQAKEGLELEEAAGVAANALTKLVSAATPILEMNPFKEQDIRRVHLLFDMADGSDPD
jgi:hypothetical protein